METVLMNARRRILPLFVIVTTTVTLCKAGHAAPPESPLLPSPDSDDARDKEDTALRLDEMDRMLASADESTARRNLWIGATTLALGAADLAAGSIAASRGSVGPAIAAFAGSAFALESGFVGLTLDRAPLHGVYEDFLSHRRSLDAATTLAQGERAWQAEAEAAHAKRIRSGVLLTTVGALVVAFSTVALATNLTVPSNHSSDGDRAAFDTVLLALSGSLLGNGVAALVEPGPIESGWQAYALMHTPVAAPRASFQLAPIRQGASIGLTLRF